MRRYPFIGLSFLFAVLLLVQSGNAAAAAQKADSIVSRLANSFDAGDVIQTARGSRPFRRIAGRFALQLQRDADTDAVLGRLTALGGPLAQYQIHRATSDDLILLQGPAAEVNRHLLARAAHEQTLRALRNYQGVRSANPVLIEPDTGLWLAVADEIVIRLKPGTDPQAYFGPQWPNVRPLRGATDQFIITSATSVEDLFTEVDRHARDPRAVWAEPNFTGQLLKQAVPNDTYFPQEWHLNNTGQGGGTAGADARATNAWQTTTGSTNIIIAILDVGVETAHPDLAPNLATNRLEIPNDGIDNDGNGFIDDVYGWDFFASYPLGKNNPNPVTAYDNHGTGVAGVAGARGNNSVGVAGIAYTSKLLPLRISETDSSGSARFRFSGMAEAVYYAGGRTANGLGTWRGADILNISSSFGGSQAVDDALSWTAANGRQGKGCPIFAAAGNNGNGALAYPASHPQTIAVGASTDSDVRSYYSQYGPGLDLMAPSDGGVTGIYTTDRTGSAGYNSNGSGELSNRDYSKTFGGTSSASPLAAGIGALMLSVNPDLSAAEVLQILRATAAKIGGVTYDLTGWNNFYGYGRVDAGRAVTASKVNLQVQIAQPTPAVQTSSGLVYTVTVTNRGPARADSLILTNWIPPQLVVVSTSVGPACSLSDSLLTCALSSLPATSGVTVAIQALATAGGSAAFVSQVTGSAIDPDPSDNTATNITSVLPSPGLPFLAIGDCSVREGNSGFTNANFLVSLRPAASITVSVPFYTMNGTANRGGDYQETNGVLLFAPGETNKTISIKVFGDTLPEPDETFSVHLVPPSTVLPIRGSGQGTILNDDSVLQVRSFANTSWLIIPTNVVGGASQYPSVLNVSNVAGVVTDVSVSLNHITHTYPQDLDILLVGPGGQKVLLMSDAGGVFELDLADVTFSDSSQKMLGLNPITSGTYKPSKYGSAPDVFPVPAPPQPYGSNLNVFAGLNPNGQWSLYVSDEAAGDGGEIRGGWSLTFSVSNSIPSADLAIRLVGPSTASTDSAATNFITVTNLGSAMASNVVVSVSLPTGAGVAFSSPTPSGNNGQSLAWALGPLNAGATATIVLSFTNHLTGPNLTEICATSDTADLQPANNCATNRTTFSTVPRLAVARSGDQCLISIASASGLQYQLQTSVALQGSSWLNVGDPIPGNDSLIQLTLPIAPEDALRFYRVSIVP